MGIFSNYINRKINEYINKEVDSVDPSSVLIKDEQYIALENRIWFEARNANDLERFYKTTYPSGGLFNNREFYRKVKGKTPRIHVPVSKTITNTIVNLVFSETPVLNVETGNENTKEEFNKEIKNTLIENNAEDLFKQIGSMVSYSGGCGIKIVIDKDVSDFSIIQPYPKEDIILKKKYGRIVSITFKDYLEDGYVLHTTDEAGHRSFKLYKNGKSAKLTDLEETSNLHDWYIVDEKGNPVKKMMSVYVENIDGKSDYDGCIDLFQLMDEIKSAMTHIQRALKPKRGIPSSLCEIDRESGKAIIPDDWDREETVLEVQDPESQIKSLNEMSFTSPDLSSYQELYDRTLKDILNAVSISESTLGNNDGGSDASSLALNIREKSSLRKRAALITRYDRAFRDLTEIILYINHSTLSNDKVILPEYSKFEYFVDFSEYNSPSFDQIVETLSKALDAGLISQREAIKELYKDDMSEEEQEKMMAEINGERQKLLSKLTGQTENPVENVEEDNAKNVD